MVWNDTQIIKRNVVFLRRFVHFSVDSPRIPQFRVTDRFLIILSTSVPKSVTLWGLYFDCLCGCSAVFTWTNLLVVVSELCGSEQDALDLVPLITNVVLEEHHLIVGVVVIVDPGVIPINSRGEKQRMHLRDSFLADQLDPIYVAYNMWAILLDSVHVPMCSNDNGSTHAATQSSITSISWSLHACGWPCHESCTVFYTWGFWAGKKSIRCTSFAERERNHFWNELH